MKKDDIKDIYGDLEAFSKEPPKELWDKIEARLHPEKKNRRGFFFLWGSAAAVLMVFLGYSVFSGSLDLNTQPIYDVTDIKHSAGSDSINKNEVQSVSVGDKESVSKNGLQDHLKTSKEASQSVASQKQSPETGEILKQDKENTSIVNNGSENDEKIKQHNDYAHNLEKYNTDNIAINDVNVLKLSNRSLVSFKNEKATASISLVSKLRDKPSLNLAEELLAMEEDERDPINLDVPSAQWSVEVLGGLSNTVSESSIQGASSNTTPQNDFVYALKVGYAISNRLSVKSGIGKNVLGQEIDNILFTSSDTSLSIDTGNIISNQEIFISNNLEAFTDVASAPYNVSEGSLQQQLDYVQLPLELSYSVLNESKYNVSFGFGGNVNFLTNNRAYLDNQQVGENLGVNKTIFGATINSNLSYKLSNALNLFLEPSYNYFQKPIDNNNQNFKNTQFRALFGLRYNF